MKKKLLSFAFISLFLVYTVYVRTGNKIFAFMREEDDDDAGRVVQPASLNLPVNNTSSNTNANPTSNVTHKYKDGQYTGIVADAYYGNIQVQAVISGGKISDVIFLQYPNDHRTSIQINTQAMPYLKAEAIQIQIAQVDIVSGATESSLAFRQSLGSALNLALK